MLRNRRGVGVLFSTGIILLLNVLFILSMFLVIWRVQDNASFYEQKYAKQISLLIDSSKPGTSISLNIGEMQEKLDENKIPITRAIVIRDNEVTVKLTEAKGYSFAFFSDYEIEKTTHLEGKRLFLDLNIGKKDVVQE